MIEIQVRERCVELKGHAGSGAFGRDIVCAAASMLAYTLAERLAEMQTQGLNMLDESGYMRVCWAEDRHAEREMFRCGVEMLAEEYPGSVIVVSG